MGNNMDKRFEKSVGIAAKAAAEGVIGTAAAFGAAVTEVIIPSTMQAVEETKKLFPDPECPGTACDSYVKSVGIAAKTGIIGTAGVVAAGIASVTDVILPSAAKAAKEIKNLYATDKKGDENADGAL